MKLPFSLACILLAFAAAGAAADWPAYRGPAGDGTAPQGLPARALPTEPIWRAATETGFSSFTVAGGKALTLVIRELDGNPMETCIALDAASGEEIWAVPLWIGGRYGHDGGSDGTPENRGGDGPRSTPVVSGGKVYILDSHLRLYCLGLADGASVWAVDLADQHGAVNIKWMNAASPVVEGDRVFVAGGGEGQSLLAFHRETGDLLWKGESDAITHATPVVADLHGTRQVIFFTQSGLVAAAVEDGRVLWRQEYPFNVSTAASPVVWEDIVYCSAGYGVGGGAYRVSKSGDAFSVAEIWRTPNDNINHWSTPVVKDGYLYGMFGFKEYGAAPLACLDIRTGEVKWSEEGFGPGNVILAADGVLAALADQGDLVLVEATPQRYAELARTAAVEGKCWSTPALAGGKLFVRSTVEGACYDLAN